MLPGPILFFQPEQVAQAKQKRSFLPLLNGGTRVVTAQPIQQGQAGLVREPNGRRAAYPPDRLALHEMRPRLPVSMAANMNARLPGAEDRHQVG
ncbi:hypothetical protein D3C73_1345950 [compost metagenome]